jgi:hypothetical protein
MTTTYTTRPLTADESDNMLTKLHLALGKTTLVDSVLGVIADLGLGIFVATETE